MNRVRSANKFLQANTWSAKAYLGENRQLFGIMAFITGLDGKPTLLFADGTYIEYSEMKLEDSRVVLSDCVLYYMIDKAQVKEIVVSPSLYRPDDLDYYENLLDHSRDNLGHKTLEEYVMRYNLSKDNLARLDELLIGDSESTVFIQKTEQLFKRD